MSNFRCQMSNIKYQMSNVKCQLSDVKCQMSIRLNFCLSSSGHFWNPAANDSGQGLVDICFWSNRKVSAGRISILQGLAIADSRQEYKSQQLFPSHRPVMKSIGRKWKRIFVIGRPRKTTKNPVAWNCFISEMQKNQSTHSHFSSSLFSCIFFYKA